MQERESGVVTVSLCGNCASYLEEDDRRTREKMEFVWPTMIWKFLTSAESLRQHGSKLWSVIPDLWRLWWLEEVKNASPELQNISFSEPKSAIADVTRNRLKLKKAIKDAIFVPMKKQVNDKMHAVVKCPWGCNEYYHKAGYAPLDIILGASMGCEGMTFVTHRAEERTETVSSSIRPNFLLKHSQDDEYILMNRAWKVMSSVAFVNGVPEFLVCRLHCKNLYGHGKYIHPPEHPFGVFHSQYPDQLAPAVAKPRTIRPIKAHKYSTTFQMQETRGQFNGVDTMQLMSHHNFKIQSELLAEKESLTIQGRPDIKHLVSEWSTGCEKDVPEETAKSLIRQAEDTIPDVSVYDEQLKNST